MKSVTALVRDDQLVHTLYILYHAIGFTEFRRRKEERESHVPEGPSTEELSMLQAGVAITFEHLLKVFNISIGRALEITRGIDLYNCSDDVNNAMAVISSSQEYEGTIIEGDLLKWLTNQQMDLVIEKALNDPAMPMQDKLRIVAIQKYQQARKERSSD